MLQSLLSFRANKKFWKEVRESRSKNGGQECQWKMITNEDDVMIKRQEYFEDLMNGNRVQIVVLNMTDF